MSDRTSRRVQSIGVAAFLAVLGVAFWTGAVAHTGIELDLGVVVIAEPRIVQAIVVEGICGTALLASAYGIVAQRPWAWKGALLSQGVAVGGVVLGTTAIYLGLGPRTETNSRFHLILFVMLVGGLVVVSTAAGRAAIDRRNPS